LGSRTKAAILTQRLREQGISDAQLRALHAPLGLDIGAETPEEIGISILAQIIEFKRKQQE
jgi:xanthine dehydrogenase accessory factor